MLFLDIHGKQKQGKRYSTFHTFSQKRNSVVLFATDLASRGVDFPAIDWVIQLDPPEDISQYIHRVGRTARYKSDGNSVLFIGQKEMNFVNELELRKIKVTKIKIGANKINNITPVVRSLLSEHTELIEIAEKAISSYVKSINLMANKNVFNIKNIDLGKLALSYGLVSSPEMIVKSKKEVEEEIEEEDNKIIDKKNKKMEEEKNLVKENLINTNTENKKKSKLFKLKEKIKLKKLMKQKEKEAEENQKEKPEEIDVNEDIEEKSENSDDAFLSVKKDKKKEKIEKTEKIDIKLGQKRKKSKSVEESEDDSEENEFYKKVKNRLEKNKEIDKQKEKERISIKHKEDKIKLKEKDYQKHGIEIEEDMPTNKYKNENDESDNENMEESLEEKSEEKNNYKNNKENKVKININHSTLKQKENAALEILKKKGIL